MKVGVSYNLWKGEEFIPYAIKTIRPKVDYIVIVYQNLSNYKQERKDDLRPVMQEWKDVGLIDDFVYYEPEFNGIEKKFWGTHNELIKRNIGLNKCRENGCDYLLDCDSDEIYDPSQFLFGLRVVMCGKFDSSFCKMNTFYKYPDCQLTPPETYYVPFIYKINKNTRFEPIENDRFPVIVDGKRRIKCKHSRIFTRDELVMYHYSYVRADEEEMIAKFENCSSKVNFSQERIKKLIHIYKNFKIGNNIEYGLDQMFGTKKVNNRFNIKL